uniref:coadhesin-like n=1 Tax=Ciona intestinalis TaxID=7719 RepID=UPI00089DBAA3|nr:coadhesin-like [Ciona intestinalis]|eukprot:XP_018670505.1 coadhesin-like [Ciona intestinalis]
MKNIMLICVVTSLFISYATARTTLSRQTSRNVGVLQSHCSPRNCTWEWGACSKSCGGGTQSAVQTRPKGRCGLCDMPRNGRTCNTQTCCKKECTWSEWTHWTACTATCGYEGVNTRHKLKVPTAASCSDTNCTGSRNVIQHCNQRCCPINCEWSTWREDRCSVSCGNGTTRQRRVFQISPTCDGKLCIGNNTREVTCNPRECPRLVVCHNTDCCQRCFRGENNSQCPSNCVEGRLSAMGSSCSRLNSYKLNVLFYSFSVNIILFGIINLIAN